MLDSPLARLSFLALPGKAFQKRRVSSPAPVTMVSPEGLMARKSTRLEWPVSVAVFCSEGYFQMVISLLEQPCVLTISLVFLENMRLHTCEPVSMLSSSEPSSVFQNFMLLSAEPPPEASTPWLCGLHASAFTAAQCELNLPIGAALPGLQRNSLLSLPPEASRLLSKDHFSPHTSCVCPSCREITHSARSRMSRITTLRSLEPLARMPSPQATELTLALWPPYSPTRQLLAASHSSMVPLLVPTAICVPWAFQLRLEMESGASSQNLRTRLLLAFQKQREESRATERMLREDHSSRLRQKSSCRLGASSTLKGTFPILRYSGSTCFFLSLLSISCLSSLKKGERCCCLSLKEPAKLSILGALLSSSTQRYICSTVIFSSFTSLPRTDSSRSSATAKQPLASPEECFRKGMKRSVECFSFSFSSCSWPALLPSNAASLSILNSEMLRPSSPSAQPSSRLLQQVEGVLARLKCGERLKWGGELFSMSIKLNLLIEILLAIKPRIDQIKFITALVRLLEKQRSARQEKGRGKAVHLLADEQASVVAHL